MRFVARRGQGRWVGRLVLALLLGAAGCTSGGVGTVTGKVTVNGVALKGGRVTYLGANGQGRTAEIKEDGSYTVTDVAAGPAKIAVETEYLQRQANRRNYVPADAQGGPKTIDPEEARRRYVPLPLNYADPNQSGLTWTVKRGKQEHNIELEDASAGKKQ